MLKKLQNQVKIIKELFKDFTIPVRRKLCKRLQIGLYLNKIY